MPSVVRLERGNRPVTSQTALMGKDIVVCRGVFTHILTGGEFRGRKRQLANRCDTWVDVYIQGTIDGNVASGR